jgi:hypothetical protein
MASREDDGPKPPLPKHVNYLNITTRDLILHKRAYDVCADGFWAGLQKKFPDQYNELPPDKFQQLCTDIEDLTGYTLNKVVHVPISTKKPPSDNKKVLETCFLIGTVQDMKKILKDGRFQDPRWVARHLSLVLYHTPILRHSYGETEQQNTHQDGFQTVLWGRTEWPSTTERQMLIKPDEQIFEPQGLLEFKVPSRLPSDFALWSYKWSSAVKEFMIIKIGDGNYQKGEEIFNAQYQLARAQALRQKKWAELMGRFPKFQRIRNHAKLWKELHDEVKRETTELKNTVERLERSIPTCVVCEENPPGVLLEPCGHVNICSTCFSADENRGAFRRCPTCRAEVTRGLRAYI